MMKSIGYNTQVWDTYASCHASVTSSFHRALYDEILPHLMGRVLDFGCGSAKLSPFLVDHQGFDHYVGIDSSPEMLAVAQSVLDRLADTRFSLILSNIDEYCGELADSAISINSFYAWPDPETTLKKILAYIKPDATFILVTPNQSLDITHLLREAEKELIAHPHFDQFAEQNYAFANSSQTNLYSLDELIRLVQGVGFRILESHDNHYLGGLTFLRLTK